MIKIEDFLADPRYVVLSDDGKKTALDRYFNTYVTQDARYQPLEEESKKEVYSRFISKYYVPQVKPKQRSFRDSLNAVEIDVNSIQPAVREGTQTMGAEDKYAAAYAKVMKDRVDAQREVEYAKRVKESAILSRAEYVPLESVKLPFSMDEALSRRIEEAQFKLQPNSYNDPLERKAAKEIVNKEKLSKAKQDYQRLTEAFSDPANADNKEQIHKDMVKTQYLMDFYATGMTADERAAMEAGQDVVKDGGAKRLGTAVGAGTLDIAGSVISLFNPDSKYARTMSSYTAGLLGKTDNPIEDAFAQVFFSMPMTLGYVVSGGAFGAATGVADAATLMHTVNINAYLMSKEFEDAYREYGSATATPNGSYLAGALSATLQTAVEMYSDVAQANLVLGKMKKLGRASTEEYVKKELLGKIGGYAGRAGKTMLTAGATEMTEEAIQSATDMIIDVVADQRPMPSIGEAIKEIGYASLVGGLGGLTFGLAGGTITESKNFYNWRNVYKLADKGNEHAKRLAEARKIIDSKTFSNKPVPQSDIQRAYEVIKDDLRAVANGTYSEDDPNIVSAMSQMYDAFAIAGIIKSPQQEQMSEGIRKGVDDYLLKKKIETAKSQIKQKQATPVTKTDYAPIQALVEKAAVTRSQVDIDAANKAIQMAVESGDRSDEIQVLTTSIRMLRPLKAKPVEVKSDQENKQGLPGEIREGKEPVQTKPVQETGTETPKTGGVVQTPQGEVGKERYNSLKQAIQKLGEGTGSVNMATLQKELGLKRKDMIALLDDVYAGKYGNELEFGSVRNANNRYLKPDSEESKNRDWRFYATLRIIDQAQGKAEEKAKSKYSDMEWIDLQAEAKKRGIRSVAVKRAWIESKLEEQDKTAVPAKPEVPKADIDRYNTEIKSIANEAKEADTPEAYDEAIKKIGELTKDADSIIKANADITRSELIRRKEKHSISDLEGTFETKQSKSMNVGKINEDIDRTDPIKTGVISKESIGKEETVYKKGKKLKIRYALVPRDKLVVSHNTAFNENPEYPQEIQNRNLATAANKAKIIETQNNYIPDMLMANPIASDGRPIAIIDKDGRIIILAGNSRMVATNRREEVQGLKDYEDTLREKLSEFGISDQDTTGKMLVGIYSGEEDLIELARLLNEQEQKALTKTEQAVSDATLIANDKKDGNDILLLLDEKTESLMSSKNNAFVEAFIKTCQIDDVAKYRSGNVFTSELEERIENALFMYIFNNDVRAGQLLVALKETGDSKVKYILNGIIKNIKPITRLRNLTEKFNLLDLDITEDLIRAISDIDQLRAEGKSLENAAWEMDIFSINEEVIPTDLLELYQAILSIDSLNKADLFIGGYYSSAYDAINPDQQDIFSGAAESKKEFFNNYLKEWMVNYGQKQKKKASAGSISQELGNDSKEAKNIPTKGKEELQIKAILQKAIDMFGGVFNANGDKARDIRRELLEAVSGTKVSNSNAGVTNYEKAIYEYYESINGKIPADTEYDRQNVIEKWVKGEVETQTPIPIAAKETPRASWKIKQELAALKGKRNKASKSVNFFSDMIKDKNFHLRDAKEQAAIRKSLAAHTAERDAYNEQISILQKELSDIAAPETPKAATEQVDKTPAPEAKSPAETFRQQWRDAQQEKLTEAQLDAQIAVLDAFTETMAAELKISVNELYSTYLGEVKTEGTPDELDILAKIDGTVRGYIRMKDGKASFTFLDPDITTGFHEMAHLGQEFMQLLSKLDNTGKWQKLLKDAEAYCGVKDGAWTKEADEKFAVSFERYVYDGVAPTSKLKTVFEKVRQWIAKVVERVKTLEGFDLSPEIINVYNVLLGGENVVASAEPAAYDEPIGRFTKSVKGNNGLVDKTYDVYDIFEPNNIRGKITGANWVVEYVVKSKLGETGYQNNKEYFATKKEALDFIERVKKNKPKPALTSEQKKQSVKLKHEMKNEQSVDHAQLESQLDKIANAKGLVLNAKKTGANIAMYLINVDDGSTIIEVHNEGEGYNVNGFYEDNNGDALAMVNELLDKVRMQDILPSDTRFQVDESYKPKKTKIAYKLFRTLKTRPGEIFPLFIGKSEPTPIGKWIKAEFIPTKGFQDRPGWHLGFAPYAPHLRRKDGSMEENRVWYEVEIPDDVDWQSIADARPTKDIRGEVPEGGYYSFKRPQAQGGEWKIAGAIKVIRPLSLEEVNRIKAEKGIDDIRYQTVNDAIDEAAKSATDPVQKRIERMRTASNNAQIRARATYRNLRVKMNSRVVLVEWENAMRKALVTSIKNSFPGSAPLNVKLYEELEKQLEMLDPGIEEEAKEIAKIKRKMKQMLKNDKRYKENLAFVSGGYEDVAYIPFEQLFTSLSKTNPAAYDAFMNDEAMAVLLDVLPKIKESFGEEFNDTVFQLILKNILSENSPYWGRADFAMQFRQPHRYLTSVFGKAGARTVALAYQGSLADKIYEDGYTPYTDKLHELLMTNKNNRGAAYEGEAGDIIGRTIFEVDGDHEITEKLPTIQKRLADWSNEHDITINPLDVAEIYEAKEQVKEIIKDYIIEWNANPAHTQKIGIREDYDNPRKYNWGNVTETTSKFTRYLFTPANARKRSKEDFSAGLDYNPNIFEAYSNYAYTMTKFMAFYDLANYVEDSTVIIPIKDKETGKYKKMYKKMGSQFDLDLTMAQRNASKSGRDYLQNYVRDAIGYHKSNSPLDRLITAARSNLYTSTLTANVVMTVLNYNQRNLIYTVVDTGIAWQVKNDFNFWSGMMTKELASYPKLSSIMQAYVIANQSLLAELSSEVNQNAELGESKLSQKYYEATAKYNNWLRKAPFTKAELGNRAWAHAAGVYQVIQNSQAYKDNIEAGMSSHEAMEAALEGDYGLQVAAVTYGGIINAEINADANPAFSPAIFRESMKMNKIAAFLRYGTTLTLLELRTYGKPKDLAHILSPDLFRLITSGNAQAATMAQTIQAAQIMKAWTDPKRVKQQYKKMHISMENNPNMLSIRQVGLVHDAISEALDTYAAAAETNFTDIVRGKQGQRKAMAKLFAFSLSEMMLRFCLELLLSLIPWWQGKKKLKDVDVISNITSIFGVFQTTKTVANYRLGVGLVPELNYYNRTDKQFFKAVTQTLLRLTPFAGTINYAGRVFTGKYLSDQFWDEVYEQ